MKKKSTKPRTENQIRAEIAKWQKEVYGGSLSPAEAQAIAYLGWLEIAYMEEFRHQNAKTRTGKKNT